MRKILVMTLILLIGPVTLFSSSKFGNDPVLLRVGDRTVTHDEFMAVYSKNNLEMEVVDPKSVDEYLELYINFNLKVLEAMSLGMDTNPDFIQELKGYRDQLARPYFNDPDVAEHIVEEAYDRMQYDLRVSHILISVGRDAAPADTLEAHRKIISLRNRALQGESFAELARTYSDDTSAKDTPAEQGRPPRTGNSGNLGYFTVFNMVYPFETAAYNTALGEISKPVRSDLGYHVVKVTDKLPAMGTARVAHIMLLTPAGSSEEEQLHAKEKIHTLYEQVLAGEDFAELARQYSEDQNSAARGGEMQPFASGRMVPEFIKAISDLHETGQVSEPLQTQFGWHIIKLIEKTPPGSYEEEYASLKSRISRDVRGQLSRQAVIDRLKQEYKVREYADNLNPFYTMVDESVFSAAWKPDEEAKLNKRILSFSNKELTQADFADYLVEKQAHRSPQEIPSYVNNMFKTFVEEKLIAYEDDQLETKYPEFKRLMKEYHDGILLFELTDKVIWTRALTDTLGLESFYEANPGRYMSEEVVDASIYSFDGQAAALEFANRIQGMAAGEKEDLLRSLANPELEGDGLKINRNRFSRGDHPALDELIWQKGVRGPVKFGDDYLVVVVHEAIDARLKAISEIRGVLISDYQQYLEEKWVEELRQKYEIFVNKDVLD